MIVLDTHTWIWWVHGQQELTRAQAEIIEANEQDTIGVSAISCWEVAKLVERGRLELPCPLEEWFELALGYPGVSPPFNPRDRDLDRVHSAAGSVSP